MCVEAQDCYQQQDVFGFCSITSRIGISSLVLTQSLLVAPQNTRGCLLACIKRCCCKSHSDTIHAYRVCRFTSQHDQMLACWYAETGSCPIATNSAARRLKVAAPPPPWLCISFHRLRLPHYRNLLAHQQFCLCESKNFRLHTCSWLHSVM